MRPPDQERRPSLPLLGLLFLRIGNLTFGGGDPTMAALERELVERHRWLAPAHYGLAYALARVTPGTNVLAFSAAAAWFLRGWPGALVAVVASTLPSAALVVWISYGYGALKGNTLAAGAILGMLASAVGMMFAAAWNLVRPRLRTGEWPRAVVLAAGSAVLSLAYSMPPVQVLVLAAVVGAFWRAPGDSGKDAEER